MKSGKMMQENMRICQRHSHFLSLTSICSRDRHSLFSLLLLLHGISYLLFFILLPDLSNDSYSTVTMGLEDGTSPHSGRASYIHGNGSTPPYLSSHSPPPMGSALSYNSYPDNIVYTSIGEFFDLYTTHSTFICNIQYIRRHRLQNIHSPMPSGRYRHCRRRHHHHHRINDNKNNGLQ